MKKLLFSISCLIFVSLLMVAVAVISIIDYGTDKVEYPVIAVEEIKVSEAVKAKSEGSLIQVKELEAEEEWEMKMCPEFSYSKDWDEDEKYLLAKIAMAEAEGESIQCKTLVIMTVLNRVQDEQFPDSIEDVIFQKTGDTYQFSCIGNGRWDRVKPSDDCYEAVEVVKQNQYDYSGNCLYFESCEEEDNWHSRNLTFLYQCGDLRFYQ